LFHKGDFGIEPCAYIIGKDAVDVVNKLIKIKEKLK
jgi:predicted fused transcriptional regulator/phosphomethylpyrimidine kinase